MNLSQAGLPMAVADSGSSQSSNLAGVSGITLGGALVFF